MTIEDAEQLIDALRQRIDVQDRKIATLEHYINDLFAASCSETQQRLAARLRNRLGAS